MKISYPYRFFVSSSAALALLISSCGPSKVAQCQEFIDVSNELSASGEALGNELDTELNEKLSSLGGSEGEPDFAELAQNLGDAADTIDEKAGSFVEESTTKLSAVALEDETLVDLQVTYVSMLDEMGIKVGDMAEALRGMGAVFAEIPSDSFENPDPEQFVQLQADLEQAEADINATAEELNDLETREDELVSSINSYCGVEAPAEE